MSEREKALLLVVDELLQAHQQWSDSDVASMTVQLADAVDDTIELFAHGDIPASCRELEKTVAELSRHWERYKDEAAHSGDPAILPEQPFWRSIALLGSQRRDAEPRRAKKLESVAELNAQKVPHRQIAKIYGWIDRDGNPETWKVEEELAKPGTHVTDGFVPPWERRRAEAERKQREILARVHQRVENKVKALTRKAPESFEELLAQKVPARQIARMKKCTVEEVLAKAKEMGVDVVMEAEDPRYATNPLDREIAPEAITAIDAWKREGNQEYADEPDDEPARLGERETDALIAEMIEAGVTDRSIIETLKLQHGINVRQRRIDRVRAELTPAE